ncbi:hypothetical protein JCM11641_002524 [Rhodosporidiobolus odoratus]
MVLLLLTSALQDRLDSLALPLELRQLVTAHLIDTPLNKVVGTEEGDTERVPGLATASEWSGTERKADRTIPHEVLLTVSRWAKGQDGLEDPDQYRLSSLLRLTNVHAPALQPREKSPELLAILSAIQLDQDRQSYAALTSLSAPPHPSLVPLNDLYDPARYGGQPKTVAEEWKEIRREVGAILNVGASMLAVGTAVWWVGGGRSYAARLCLAMLGAVSIAAIEAFLYYRFFTRDEREAAEASKRAARTKTPKRTSPMALTVDEKAKAE